MKKLLYLFISVSILAFSCNNSENNSNDSDSSSVEANSNEVNSEENSSNDNDRIYGVKEGMVEYEMDLAGISTGTIIIYFKDYGNIECTVTDMEMMGMKTLTRTLEVDGYMYSLNMTQKTGSKSKLSEDDEEFAPNNFNFDNISSEMKKEMKLEEIGTEEVAGKDCKVYELLVEGQKAKFYVWENIPVKYEMSQNNLTMIMKAIKIEKNPSFPSGIFEIPSDFKITDMEEL